MSTIHKVAELTDADIDYIRDRHYEMFTDDGNTACAEGFLFIARNGWTGGAGAFYEAVASWVETTYPQHGEVWDTEPRYHIKNLYSQFIGPVSDEDAW